MVMQGTYDRRTFLASTGVLGAALALPGGLLPGTRAPTEQALVKALRPALQELSRETIAALAAFVVPGDDRLSRLQGTPEPAPGALAAQTDQMVMDTIDRYFAFPDRLYLPIAVEAMRRMGGVPGTRLRLPAGAARLGARDLRRLDALLLPALTTENDANVPATGMAALLLNLEASILRPDSPARPGALSPFAKLSWREKALVFRDLESPRPRLMRALQETIPRGNPIRQATLDEFNRLLKFLSGALLALPALGAFSEYAVHRPGEEDLRARPVGWDLTNYLPGRTRAVEGHDELLGYYRGIK